MTSWLLLLSLGFLSSADTTDMRAADPVEVVELGLKHANGEFTDEPVVPVGSYQEALRFFKIAANQGLPTAQFNAGLILEQGLAGEINLYDAANYYRLAASQGHAGAQTNLGNLYQHGLGVPKSSSTALQWYQKSIAQGDTAAMFNAAIIYHHEQRYQDAYQLFNLAAEQGDARAQFNLYQYDIDSSNDEAALFWLMQAVEQKFPPALFEMGKREITLNGSSNSWAYEYIKEAADTGYAPAVRYLTKELTFSERDLISPESVDPSANPPSASMDENNAPEIVADADFYDMYSLINPERVVRRGPVNLRAGATTGHAIKATLENNTPVNIVRFVDNLWAEVDVPSLNKRGFIIYRVLDFE